MHSDLLLVFFCHDLDLLGSRNVPINLIPQVQFPRYAIVTESVSPTVFDTFGSKSRVRHVEIVIAHVQYDVTYTPGSKSEYIFEFLSPTLPIHCHAFIWLR